jgi:hypothetical protein
MYDFHTIYKDVEKAAILAAYLNEQDEDGWKYQLTLTPNGKAAVIEIYDETGYLVGLL